MALEQYHQEDSTTRYGLHQPHHLLHPKVSQVAMESFSLRRTPDPVLRSPGKAAGQTENGPWAGTSKLQSNTASGAS